MGGNISFELFLAREIMKAKFFEHATDLKTRLLQSHLHPALF